MSGYVIRGTFSFRGKDQNFLGGLTVKNGVITRGQIIDTDNKDSSLFRAIILPGGTLVTQGEKTKIFFRKNYFLFTRTTLCRKLVLFPKRTAIQYLAEAGKRGTHFSGEYFSPFGDRGETQFSLVKIGG